jgi:hypothetical protein
MSVILDPPAIIHFFDGNKLPYSDEVLQHGARKILSLKGEDLLIRQ